jgi:uncharacterized protein (TIGR02594 family)
MLKLGSKGPDVERLQTLLNGLLKPSPRLRVHGDFGKKSHDALLLFQESRNLKADGEVGPRTWKALGQQPAPVATVVTVRANTPARPWMTIAEAEVGVRENAAAGQHNQRILEFHTATSLRATEDEVPWCSSFVNWVMVQSGRAGTKSAAARSWLNWGTELKDPRLGSITVIKKKTGGADKATGSSSGFHVAFFVSATESHIRLLGGNQSDSVKYSNFPLSKYDVKGYRWPS